MPFPLLWPDLTRPHPFRQNQPSSSLDSSGEALPWAPIGHRPSPEPLTVAREDGTHQLARSRSCDHTLQDTCGLLTLCQGWRQCNAPRAGLRVGSLCPCAQCPGTCLHILSTHRFVPSANQIFMTHLIPSQALFQAPTFKGARR